MYKVKIFNTYACNAYQIDEQMERIEKRINDFGEKHNIVDIKVTSSAKQTGSVSGLYFIFSVIYKD